METTNPATTETKPADEQVAQQQQPAAEEKKKEDVKEEYKDLGEYEATIVPVPADKKVVPTASYGHRIRIAKLFDSHEEFMYKIINIAGWARTVRSGGKDFCFIEVSDGSYMKGIQVRHKDIIVCIGRSDEHY